MDSREFMHIAAAIILMSVVGGFAFAVEGDWSIAPSILFFSTLIIFTAVFSKKLAAYFLDCNAEHEFWIFSRYGVKPGQHFKKPIPAGIIFPLVFGAFTLGLVRFCAFLTYEARALKKRAAKRQGFYSYSALSEWHNGLIGAVGIISVLLLAGIVYFLPYDLQYFSKLAVYYAASNMLPLGKLDGNQIFFGSRVLYTVIGVLTLIFFAYALII